MKRRILVFALVVCMLCTSVSAAITTEEAYIADITAQGLEKAKKLGYDDVGDWVEDLNANTTFREHASSENRRLIYEKAPFTDIEEGRWSFEAIDKLYNEGIVTGTSELTFNPEGLVSRGEFAAMLMRGEKIKFADKSVFVDQADKDWHMPYLSGAANEGILPETMINNGKVFPDMEITRQEIAAMAVLVYEYKTKDKRTAPMSEYSDYVDIDTVYTAFVDKAGYLGIMEGSEGFFNPKTSVTREEAAAVVLRTMTCIEDYIRKYISKKPVELKAISKTPIEIEGERWTLPPYITDVTEAVEPGGSVMLYGDGYSSNTKVKISKITPGEIPVNPPGDAIACEVTLYDSDKKFVNFTMPEGIEPGAYYVWASNSLGESETRAFNTARLQWVSESTAGYGQTIQVIGRNLDASEFGAESLTRVVLSDGNNTYECIVEKLTPFAIDFIIPYDIPKGDYEVWASNDGIVWAKSEDGRKLTIKGEIYDPLSLGVGWADEFVWDKIFNVMDYGAQCNGINDDSLAIQAALDAANEADGGVVYLPDNTYTIKSGIFMPEKTVLAGESRKGTIIDYKSIPDLHAKHVISNKDGGKTNGRTGVFRCTFVGDINTVDTPNEPDIFMYTGQDWTGETDLDKRSRTACYFFIKDIDVKMAWTKGPARGIGVVTVGNSHFLCQGSNFSGNASTYSDTRQNEYLTFKENDFITAYGPLGVNCTYGIYENNHKENIDRALCHAFIPFSRQRQGFFVKAPAYVADNTVIGTGTSGGARDGEIICCEWFLSHIAMVGDITGTNGTSLTINPRLNDEGTIWGGDDYTLYGDPTTWDSNGRTVFGMPGNKWVVDNDVVGVKRIIITEGRGLGQSRIITGLDEATKTVTVDKPWDIQPNKTSKFEIVVTGGDRFTIYNNEAYDCFKGIWLYNGSYDCAVSNNYMDTTEGIVVKAALTDYRANRAFNLAYHTRIDNNVIDKGNPSPRAGSLCGFDILLYSGKANGYMVYGGTLRNNKFMNVNTNGNLWGGSDCVASGALGVQVAYQYVDTPFETDMVAKGIIIENNETRNTNYGIVIGNLNGKDSASSEEDRTNGIVVRNNKVTNAGVPYLCFGVKNFVLQPADIITFDSFVTENFD